MDVSRAAASISAMNLANAQAQVALAVLRKTLDLQQANAMQLLEALPAPVDAGGKIGSVIDIYV